LTFFWEDRLDAERFENFPAQRCGLISITVILRDSFKFEKLCQLFVGTESLSGVADNFAGIAEPRPAR